MPQFTIKPATLITPKVSFTHNTGITIDSIENIYALATNFSVGDTIDANAELNTIEGFEGGNFIPEIIVNYTEI
jgi:hypothetical protein